MNETIEITLGPRALGETDDTNRIRRAIEEAVNRNIRVIKFAAGKTYSISNQINLPPQTVSFVCDGMTTIKAITEMDAMFRCIHFWQFPTFEGITIDGASLVNYCLDIEVANTPIFLRCHFKNARIAPLALGKAVTGTTGISVYEARFSEIKITGGENGVTPIDQIADYGILLRNGASDNHLNDIVIRNIKRAGILDNASNNMYNNIHIFGYPEPDFSPEYGIDLVYGRAIIIGLYTDGVRKAGVKIRGGSTSIVASNFFWNFEREWDKTQTAGVEIDAAATNYTIANCTFRGYVGYDIRYLGRKAGIIFGNTSLGVTNKAGSFIFNENIEISNNFNVNSLLTAQRLQVNNGAMINGNTTINGSTTINGNAVFNSSAGISLKNNMKINQTNNSAELALSLLGLDASKFATLALGQGELTRWKIQKNNDVEDGANGGSNFAIVSHNDAGAYLSTPLKIDRKTSNVNLTGNLTLNSANTGIVLTTPSGYKKKLSIDDNGNIVIT